jgi:hypothetical protein
MMKTLEEQLGGWCQHFNGVDHEACKAGIAYKDVVQDGKFPCLKDDDCMMACPHVIFPTVQEAAEEAARINTRVAEALLSSLARGLCPHCHTKIEEERQVGRCVYARPCGHRLYQGKARTIIPNAEDSYHD